MCGHITHNIYICYYLRCRRKVIVDDYVQKVIERMERQIITLNEFRKNLRRFHKLENRLYENNGMRVISDICWKRIHTEDSD